MVFSYLYGFSYAEPQLILCKDNPITFKHKIKGSETYLFSLNPTKILYF